MMPTTSALKAACEYLKIPYSKVTYSKVNPRKFVIYVKRLYLHDFDSRSSLDGCRLAEGYLSEVITPTNRHTANGKGYPNKVVLTTAEHPDKVKVYKDLRRAVFVAADLELNYNISLLGSKTFNRGYLVQLIELDSESDNFLAVKKCLYDGIKGAKDTVVDLNGLDDLKALELLDFYRPIRIKFMVPIKRFHAGLL